MFRYKDLKSWWTNPHYNRIAGVEATTATPWVPQSKPFWFMEIGCPAVDKGANQPNVFVDPKSSESVLPFYSSGARDDLMQRRLLQAIIESHDPEHVGYITTSNPVSALTNQRMIDMSRMHVYAWDARPYPAFPNNEETWLDAGHWRVGHWINGRTASAPVPGLVARLLQDFGFTDFEARNLTGTAAGLVLDRLMSAREALQPLELAFFFDAHESQGQIIFRPRGGGGIAANLTLDDLVEPRAATELLRLTRAQETDLPASAMVSYIAATGDYPQAVAEARRNAGSSGRISSASLGIVLDPTDAEGIAESWLFEAWAARERASFALPPSRLAIEPGDTVTLNTGTCTHTLRVAEVGDHGTRDIEARSVDRDVYRAAPATTRETTPLQPTALGQPLVMFLDIPPGVGMDPHTALVAVAQDPWPGAIAVFRSPEQTGYTLSTLLARAATTGLTAAVLTDGPASRLDAAAVLTVVLDRGILQSVTQLALLGGANTAAVEVAPNRWEILQFQFATLVAPRTYRLTNLLRGQRGTEHLLGVSIPASARFVIVDDAVRPLALAPDDVGLTLNWKTGPASRDIGDTSYGTSTQRFTGQGLKPFSPVHIRPMRTAAGDLTLTWVRRTRLDGDSWETIDAPIGETSELYEIDILAGSTVLRTLTAISPTVGYSAVHQTADFGSPQSTVTIRIAQVNPGIGRGHARTLIL